MRSSLIDIINDEKMGCQVLFDFTAGYGAVPINIYNFILPLLSNSLFLQLLANNDDIQTCFTVCNQKDENFANVIIEMVKNTEEITNRYLALLLLNHELDFNIENGMMTGNCRYVKKNYHELAKKLGCLLQGKESDEIMMMLRGNFKIVFLDRETLGSDIDCSKLYQYGNTVIYEQTRPDQIVERIEDATVVITNKHVLNADILKQAPNLKLICVTATGFNNIDLKYCNEAKITVCNVMGYSTDAVAQHTFALLLDLYNKNHYYHQYVASGNYSSSSMFTHLGYTFHELKGKVWGIVGLGAIGKQVAKIAKAFGCQIQYYSTSNKNIQDEYHPVSFDVLLKTSDIISIHAPLNENTAGLFNQEAFSKMKRNAYLINVGRGKIVDEQALVAALKNNQIAGAGLDVFEQEPLTKDNILLTINDPTKLLMTPHIAWAPIETRNRVIEEVCLNIEMFKQGKPRNVCQ